MKASKNEKSKVWKNIEDVWNRFRYLIIAYIIVCLILFLLQHFQQYLPCNLNDSFVISFKASLLEDLLFFGIIGITALYISVKPFEQEDFNVRVKSLANNVDNINAVDHLKDEIKKLLAYTDQLNITLKIKEINESKNLAYIYSSIENEILNMCNDVEFIFFDTRFFIEPNREVNNDYGYISYMGIEDTKDDKNKRIFFNDDIYPLTNKDKVEKPIKDFEIQRGSSAIWRLSFATWGKIGNIHDNKNVSDCYEIKIDKFTNKANLVIVNETNHDISLDVVSKYLEDGIEGEKSEKISGKDTEKIIFKDKSFEKNDIIQIKFQYEK